MIPESIVHRNQLVWSAGRQREIEPTQNHSSTVAGKLDFVLNHQLGFKPQSGGNQQFQLIVRQPLLSVLFRSVSVWGTLAADLTTFRNYFTQKSIWEPSPSSIWSNTLSPHFLHFKTYFSSSKGWSKFKTGLFRLLTQIQVTLRQNKLNLSEIISSAVTVSNLTYNYLYRVQQNQKGVVALCQIFYVTFEQLFLKL